MEKEIVEFNKRNITVCVSGKGYNYTYFAARDFSRDEKLMQCFGNIVDHHNSLLSIQTGRGFHIIPGDWTGKNLNHSCEPNAYVNCTENGFPVLYALSGIKKGEEITYHYGMTEFCWDKNSKERFLLCLCETPSCKGRIHTFSQLSLFDQKVLIKNNLCSDYLVPVPMRHPAVSKGAEIDKTAQNTGYNAA